jgi:hypothetical protein
LPSRSCPFADAFAPDYKQQPFNVPLADFFPLTSTPPFQAITLPPGAPDANYFINYNGPILDPDNDGIDNEEAIPCALPRPIRRALG